MGDIGLAVASPCLPGQHPDGYECGLIGASWETCSTTTGVEEATSYRTSWSGVKTLFR